MTVIYYIGTKDKDIKNYKFHDNYFERIIADEFIKEYPLGFTITKGTGYYKHDCGKLVEENETIITHDDRIICEKCYESNDYFTCERCGKVVEDCHIVHIQDTEEYVCDDCAEEHYYQCMECGDWYSGNRIITDAEGQHLCEDCYCDNYYTCADCGEFVHQDNVYREEKYEYKQDSDEEQGSKELSYSSWL